MELELLNFLIPLLITGLISGLIAGLLGVGGGIIIVPVVYYILNFNNISSDIIMHISVASSIGVIFFTSLTSIYTHYKLNNIDKTVISKWFIGTILGSIFGALSASFISDRILVIIFVIIAIIISINMLFNKKIIISKDFPKNIFINNLISFIIGYLSVIIGIGGGSFSVPTLIAFGKNIYKAIGTSATIGFFIALPGLITYGYADIENLPKYSLGYVNVPIVISIALTSIFTAPLGAKLSKKINSKLLKKIFAIFLLFTCLSLLINQLF